MSSRPRTGWWTWVRRAATTAGASSPSAHRNRWRPTRLLTRVIICAPRWRRRAVSSANGHERRGLFLVRVTGQFAPLLGILIGILGGAVYWLAVQIWPSSVAVILSIALTPVLTTAFPAVPAARFYLLSRVLCLLIKYNALMALV